MDDFALFVCGIVVTLVAGMGVITSQVFLAYTEHLQREQRRVARIQKKEQENHDAIKQTV
tara:strand:- start:561 stop:740 length:180 start_codon:yes stop_codon:yes gene_type:complete